MSNPIKPLKFLGSSHDDLRAMPESIRHAIGVELLVVQFGGVPSDFKPMSSVGEGVYEIRVRDASGAFRVMYVAKFADAIYVLHAFQKKTQKTSKTDLDLAVRRYKLIGAK
jgi:phage-related protein